MIIYKIHQIQDIDIEKMLGDKSNLNKEAGIKDSFSIALMSALIAVMSGSAISSAVKKYDLQQNEIQEMKNVLQDPQKYQQFQKELQSLRQQFNEDRELKEEQERQRLQDEERLKELSLPVNIIARTLYAEGRGESEEGLYAIASVIYNRSNKTPDGMVKVIQQPRQFSCWNGASAEDWTNMKTYNDNEWEKCMRIAESMALGNFSPTGNWNHYYNPNLANPDWAYLDKNKTQKRPHDVIGNHNFMYIRW